ncbi:hypothetical protein L1887_45746 [Cichorium endivia]|nr:hypothetical protein L1887_45746 [Cichorium endivia]
MFVDHLSRIVVVALVGDEIVFRLHHRTSRQFERLASGNARMRPVHDPGHSKPVSAAQRRIDGKTAMLDVGQQMGEIALKRENPVMLAKRIDKRGIRMVKPDQRRRRLAIQCGVVLNKPTHDRGQRTHGSHPGCKQRGVIAYLKLTQLLPESLLQVMSQQEIIEAVEDGDRIIIDQDGNASVNYKSNEVRQDFLRHVNMLKRA